MNKKPILLILTILSALSLSICAAYYSVFGLSKLFSGAGLAVIIMGSVLEGSKLIATSVIHQYWDKLSITLRLYLITAVVGLMLITSAGIYGFLTSSYQETANKLDVTDSKIKLLDNKKQTYIVQIDRINKQITSKEFRISQLTTLRQNQEARIDSLYKKGQGSAARRTETLIKDSDKQIESLSSEISIMTGKLNGLNDSIATIETKSVEMSSNSDVAAEIGPLKYLSKLTNKPMDVVINWFTLLLIFVFDPLAIALVIVVNKVLTPDDHEPTQIITKKIEEQVLTENTIKVQDETPIEVPEVHTDQVKEPIKPAVDTIIETGNVVESDTVVDQQEEYPKPQKPELIFNPITIYTPKKN